MGDPPDKGEGKDASEPDSQRLTLGFAFGRTERGWEWRDGLGCYWFAGLLVTLVVFAWLASIGVAQIVLEPLALAALIGLAVLFILGARGARPPHS